jgi:hypothetical protein
LGLQNLQSDVHLPSIQRLSEKLHEPAAAAKTGIAKLNPRIWMVQSIAAEHPDQLNQWRAATFCDQEVARPAAQYRRVLDAFSCWAALIVVNLLANQYALISDEIQPRWHTIQRLHASGCGFRSPLARTNGNSPCPGTDRNPLTRIPMRLRE